MTPRSLVYCSVCNAIVAIEHGRLVPCCASRLYRPVTAFRWQLTASDRRMLRTLKIAGDETPSAPIALPHSDGPEGYWRLGDNRPGA